MKSGGITAGERLQNLDVLKAFCAFLVVCIHMPFPGETGTYVTAMARMAVPVFFMITGYFYAETRRRGKEKSQIRRLFKLMVCANLLYAFWDAACAMLSGSGLGALWNEVGSLQVLLKFLVLNVSPFSGHLWYFGAILYVLMIVWFAERHGMVKWLYRLTPVLLTADLLFGKYARVLFGREFSYIYVRNFMFVGIPYFCIGRMLYIHREWIRRKIRPSMAFVFVVVFCAMTAAERWILMALELNTVRDHYLGTTFLAVSAFCLALTAKEGTSRAVLSAAGIGREDSARIYILHPMVGAALAGFLKIVGWYNFVCYAEPLLVYFCAWAISALYDQISEKLKDNFRIRLVRMRMRFGSRAACCGCGACHAVCPVNAVKMEMDTEGFLYPVTDSAACTHCGLCRRVCGFQEAQDIRSGKERGIQK